jgi:hypothetical protein
MATSAMSAFESKADIVTLSSFARLLLVFGDCRLAGIVTNNQEKAAQSLSGYSIFSVALFAVFLYGVLNIAGHIVG